MTTDNNDAWEQAATNQTRYMHPDDDDVQAADLAAWAQAHPDAVTRWQAFRRAVRALGVLCLVGVAVGLMAGATGRYGLSHDTRWLGAAMAGGLVAVGVLAHLVDGQRAVRK